jgi:hypothetical protein
LGLLATHQNRQLFSSALFELNARLLAQGRGRCRGVLLSAQTKKNQDRLIDAFHILGVEVPYAVSHIRPTKTAQSGYGDAQSPSIYVFLTAARSLW